MLLCFVSLSLSFFFKDTATTEIYTLSLHDALPICHEAARPRARRRSRHGEGHRSGRARDGRRRARRKRRRRATASRAGRAGDRKSTRLNSSHVKISYAVFCLKKKKKEKKK